jgi:hypothetical protein
MKNENRQLGIKNANYNAVSGGIKPTSGNAASLRNVFFNLIDRDL